MPRSHNLSLTVLVCEHFFIIFAIFLLFAIPCNAHRIGYKPPANQLNRRFAWSSEAPLTRAVNDLVPEAIPYFDLIIRHAARLERAANEALERGRVMADSPVQPCNPRIRLRYLWSIHISFGMMGLPQPAWSCATEVIGVKMAVNDTPGYTVDDIYEALVNRRATMQLRAGEIAPRVIQNFTRPRFNFEYSHDTTSARCAITPACMYRVGDNWHTALSLNNGGIDDHVVDGKRQSTIEFVRVVNGKLGDNVLLRLPVFDEGGVKRVYLTNATTLLQRWRRTPNPTCFSRIERADNPALLESLDLMDHALQQVQDAVTPSNLAILLFPVGLTLVPVALFAEVGTRAMLTYMLLSDVLAVVPLAIKGVELERFRRQRFRSVVSRVMTNTIGNLTLPAGAGAEVWGAECRIREEDGRVGMVLVIVALVFLCIGISAELAAAWYTKNRIRGTRRGLVAKTRGKLGGYVEPERPVLDWEVGACGVESRYSDDDEPDRKCKGGE